MSDQVDKQEFITTIKELMRLTREGVLDWSVDHATTTIEDFTSPTNSQRLPTYKAEYENLVFIIEDAAPNPVEKSLDLLKTESRRYELPGDKYRLKIKDKEDSSKISSPPMKPIKDLVSVIETKPQKEKLKDINKKLSEIRD